MNPYLLRQLWSLVESSQKQWLLSLDDNSLVRCLIDQVTGKTVLDQAETARLDGYIRARIPLIRDMAQQ